MTRSAFAGQQHYGSNMWSGDVASSWDMLRKQIPAGLSFSLTGDPNFNTDIGGFFCSAYNTQGPATAPQNPQFQELYVRWMQYGLFCPVFRSHGADAPREIWQFYQPPLHHIIAGLWLRFLNLFGFEFIRLAEGVQVLTLFYSCSCTIIFWRILGELKVKGSAKLVAFLIMAFNPSFVIFSGSINNDILSITFMLAAMLYTIRWYNNRSFKNIICLAFTIGLSMMSKLSGALIAPAVAVVFLYCLVKHFKAEYKKLLPQFFVFGLICIPLGLWWSIRNFILFKIIIL